MKVVSDLYMKVCQDSRIKEQILRVEYVIYNWKNIAGIYLEDNNRPVAIKFVKDHQDQCCQREIEALSYLKAYKNESVEQFGIPVVYYYGRWQMYILTALTKLDNDLFEMSRYSTLRQNPLDVLILFRDFVSFLRLYRKSEYTILSIICFGFVQVFQSKYIHSHGVRHDDIKPGNIMVRGSQSFLIGNELV